MFIHLYLRNLLIHICTGGLVACCSPSIFHASLKAALQIVTADYGSATNSSR